MIQEVPMPIRLIVTDIDGTLIDSPRCTSISPRNMAALRRAREQGVTLAIASGRNHAYCQLLAEEIGFSGILISNAGSEVRDSSMARANTRDTSFFMRSSSFYFSFSAP